MRRPGPWPNRPRTPRRRPRRRRRPPGWPRPVAAGRTRRRPRASTTRHRTTARPPSGTGRARTPSCSTSPRPVPTAVPAAQRERHVTAEVRRQPLQGPGTGCADPTARRTRPASPRRRPNRPPCRPRPGWPCRGSSATAAGTPACPASSSAARHARLRASVGTPVGVGAGDGQGERRCGVRGDVVVEADGVEHRRQVVVAVGPARSDPQGQVDLRGDPDAHGRRCRSVHGVAA